MKPELILFTFLKHVPGLTVNDSLVHAIPGKNKNINKRKIQNRPFGLLENVNQ